MKQAKSRGARRWVWIGAAVAVIAMGGAGYAAFVGLAPVNYVEDARRLAAKGDMRGAIIQLKNAVREKPGDAAARLALGEAYLLARDPGSAEKELKAALERGSHEPGIVAAVARAYFLQGKHDLLLQEIPAGERPPEVESQVRVWRGYAHLGLRDVVAAQRSFEEAIKLASDKPHGYVGLARVLLEKGQRESAESVVDTAVRLDPAMPEALALKGELRRLQGDPEAAIAAYEKAIERDGANLVARIGRAALRLDRDDSDRAQADITAILRVQPSHPIGAYLQALLHSKKQNYPAAVEALQKAEATLGAYPPGLYLQAAVLASTQQYEQAEAIAVRYAEAARNDPRGWRLLAMLAARRNDFGRAVEVLDRALKLTPDDPQLLVAMANAHMRKRDFEEGARWFEKAAAAMPDTAASHTQIGLARLQLGQAEGAVRELETALERDPSAGQARLLLALTHMRGRNYPAAEEAARELAAQMPDSPMPANLLGTIAVAKNDLNAARSQFERALEIKSDFTPALMNLAQLELGAGDAAKAAARYAAVLKIDPRNVEAMMANSALALRQDKRDEAVEWLEKAQAANPSAIQPRLRLVELHLNARDTKKALAVAGELRSIAPTNVLVLAALGQAQLASGESASATATFRQLVERAPESVEAHYRFARALLANGDAETATGALRKALTLDKNHLMARADLVELESRAGRTEVALKLAEEGRKMQPAHAIPDILVGDVLLRGGRQREAVPAYEAAQKKQATSAVAIKLAEALSKSGDPRRALAVLGDWVQKNPNDGAVRFALAGTQLQLKEYDQSIAEHEKLLAASPDNPVLLNNLAWLYGERKDPRAIAYAEKAYELGREAPTIGDTLGWLLVRQGDATRGVRLLERALAKAPGVADIQYHLAFGLKQLGRRDEARRLLEDALAAGTPFDESENAKSLLRELR